MKEIEIQDNTEELEMIKKAKELMISLLNKNNYFYWGCLVKNNKENIAHEYFSLAIADLIKSKYLKSKECSYEHCMEYSKRRISNVG